MEPSQAPRGGFRPSVSTKLSKQPRNQACRQTCQAGATALGPAYLPHWLLLLSTLFVCLQDHFQVWHQQFVLILIAPLPQLSARCTPSFSPRSKSHESNLASSCLRRSGRETFRFQASSHASRSAWPRSHPGRCVTVQRKKQTMTSKPTKTCRTMKCKFL